MDLCFTVTLSAFCLFIPFLRLCAILHCVLYHHHLQLATLKMMCGSKRNLIDFDGLRVAHFCQTD